MHSEELQGLWSSLSIIRMNRSGRMRWVGHVGIVGEITNAHNILVGKPEGERPVGSPRYSWGNIKMDEFYPVTMQYSLNPHIMLLSSF
jgi:hypothetical protein